MALPKKTDNNDNPKEATQSMKTKLSLPNDKKSYNSKDENKKTAHRTPIQQKYSHAKIANWIASIAVIVSIVLAGFTYSLFRQASNQTIFANKSAAAAVTADSIANNSYHLSDSIYKVTDTANKNTLAETKRYNNSFLNSQKTAIDENKKEADSREKREKEAFEETKKEFEVENRPYLQLVNIKIDTIERGRPITLTYYFNNYGKFPANVLFIKTQLHYDNLKEYKVPKSFKDYSNVKTNFYIANGISQQLYTVGVDTLPQLFVDEYKKGEISLFFFGYCEFVNPITAKKFIYKFKDRINTKPSFTEEVQENSVEEESTK